MKPFKDKYWKSKLQAQHADSAAFDKLFPPGLASGFPATPSGPPVAPSNHVLPSLPAQAIIGQQLPVNVGVWTGTPSPIYQVEWLIDGTPVAGESAFTYVPRPADDGKQLSARVTAINSAGSLTKTSASVTVKYQAPTYIPPIPPLAAITGAPINYDVSMAFVGDGLVYTVANLPSGLTLSGHIITGSISTPSSGTFTITATNSGGTVSAPVAWAVTDAAAPPAAFAASDWSLADKQTDGALTLTISALPADGGAAITAVQYAVDGGAWQSTGLTSPGSFDITGLTNGTQVSVTLRALNAQGAGAVGPAHVATPTDQTAPVLSGTSVTALGADKATLKVTTDTPEGEIRWIATTNQGLPSAAQVFTGDDITGTAAGEALSTQNITTSGQKQVSTGILADGTWYFYCVHRDLAGNYSAVADLGSLVINTLSAPANTALPQIGFAGSTGAQLAVQPGSWTGQPTSIVRKWYHGTTLLVQGDTWLPKPTGQGDGYGWDVTVKETATNGAGSTTVTSQIFTVPNVPAAGTTGNFSLTVSGYDLTINVTSPINDRGAPIILLEYSIDNQQTWHDIGFTGTGSKTVASLSPGQYGVRLRATNRMGLGPVSVQKSATISDITAPTVTNVTPANGLPNVAVDAPVSITYSEPIQKGAGNALIKDGATTIETVPVANCTVSGATITIPHANLPNSKTITIALPSGFVKDLAGNDGPGSNWAFDTAAPQITAPAAFASGDWTLADKQTDGALTLTISAMPADGGAAITAVQYAVDGGAWQSTGLTAPGSFDIPGLTNGTQVNVTLRAVNSQGGGDVGPAKAATPTDQTAPVLTSPSVVAAGVDRATLKVTTDTAEGEIRWIATTNQGLPSSAQIFAGNDSTGVAAGEAMATTGISSAGLKLKTTNVLADGTWYFYAAHKDAAGNYSNVADLGSLTISTVTAPAPTINSLQMAGTYYITVRVGLDGPGKAFAVIIPSSEPAPSAAQIVAGQRANGTAADASGGYTFTAAGSNKKIIDARLMPMHVPNVQMKVYMVAQDSGGTVTSAPVATTYTPYDQIHGASAVDQGTGGLLAKITGDVELYGGNQWTIYAVAVAGTAPATPSVAQIIAGQDASGNAAALSGSASGAVNHTQVSPIDVQSGLQNGDYRVFFVMDIPLINKQSMVKYTNVTITSAVAAPTMTQPTWDGANNKAVATVNQDGTVYGIVNDIPGGMSGAAVAAASGSGTPVSAGTPASVNIDLTGQSVGDHYLHMVMKNAAGAYTTDKPVIVTVADFVTPTVSAVTPVNNATDVATNAPIQITYSEPIQKGAGSLLIKDGSTTLESVAVASCSVSGSTITIPHAALPNAKAITIAVPSGFVKDLAGNNGPGSNWTFTTVAASSANPTVRASSGTVVANGPSIDVPMPTGVVNGDHLVVAIASYVGKTLSAAGWTEVGSIEQPSSLNRKLSVFHKVANNEPANVTFTAVGGWGQIAASVVAIKDAGSVGTPSMAAPTAFGTSTNAPVLSGVTAGSLVLGLFGSSATMTGAELVKTQATGATAASIFAHPNAAAGTGPTITASQATANRYATGALEIKK